MYDIPRISSEYLLNDLAKYEGKIWELIGVSNLFNVEIQLLYVDWRVQAQLLRLERRVSIRQPVDGSI